ncbi:hypothetical protein DBR32_09975 [Taibaiella sp. KBW10]|uniref:hypothetical protein n=1 Tax=Taibaiella sp. KBW10 TaxID=2153357 RepID=UPI000F5AC4C8|nr:hypothetical protein [Taibaiella sp. KBW10]RQO31025.1 hypothetical protein DBR32_09975 [Taibaiella sp. KBW10]
MIQKISVVFLLFFSTTTVSAQNQPLQLSGRKVFYKGVSQSRKDLLYITKNDPIAYHAVVKSGTNQDASMIFSIIGGALIGSQIGGAIAGQPMNIYLLCAGSAAITISIPCDLAYKRHLRSAVHHYNEGLSSANRKLQVELGLSENGLGLRLKF